MQRFHFGINSFVCCNTALPAVTTIVTVNPVIYCFTYERFQKQARKMMRGGYQHNVNRVDTTSGSTRQVTNAQHTAQVSVISAPSIPHVEP